MQRICFFPVLKGPVVNDVVSRNSLCNIIKYFSGFGSTQKRKVPHNCTDKYVDGNFRLYAEISVHILISSM